jgi:hypothetical protein
MRCGPFAALAELAAHEQQLLARMRPHEGVVGAQIREALPVVARHPPEDRALAVHHLVMAERQHEVLGEGVEQAEGQLVVVIAAIERVAPDVVERVVHPAHVPLVAEAQAPGVDRLRHARPGGGFLGDGHDRGVVAIDGDVHRPQEVERFEVLAPAEAVGDPLALLAGIVAVEHRRDRIHPQPVDMMLACSQ